MDTTEAQQFWENLYNERPQRWSGKVNAPLEQRVRDLPPGRALDLGCGEGADALWLAERGWTVTGVDISNTALTRAREEAERRDLTVEWVQQDLADPVPPGPYDLVSAQFLQSPVPFARADVLQRAAAEVGRGGLLLVVGHAAGPPWSPHQPDPALMPDAEAVLVELGLDAGWEVIEARDVGRTAAGPDGQVGELLDSVVLARRR